METINQNKAEDKYLKTHSEKRYYSERGLELIFKGTPNIDRPVVTVEDYCKWYTLYLIHSDGKVERLEGEDLWELDGLEPGNQHWEGDHIYNPHAVERLAKEKGWEVCYISLEVMIGRWVIEAGSETGTGKYIPFIDEE